jgi:hypothetical protein
MVLLKAPRPSNVTAVAVLVVLLMITMVLPQSLLTGLAEAGFVALLAAEIDRSGRHLALRIVGCAAHLVPKCKRTELVDEWRDHVLAAGEEGLRPLIAAVSVVHAAIAIAFRDRVRVYIALRLLLGFGSCVVMQHQLVLALSKRRVALPRAIVVATLSASLAVPLHLVRPSSRAWPLWLRIALGAIVALGLYLGVILAMRALVPVLTMRLSALVIICSSFGAASASLVADFDAVMRFAALVGGKPMRDALAACE